VFLCVHLSGSFIGQCVVCACLLTGACNFWKLLNVKLTGHMVALNFLFRVCFVCDVIKFFFI
jgi:hypothetical protein